MASTGKCPFCGAVVTSDQKNCPDCGGENPNYSEDQPRQIIRPKTLSELKEYCAERGMPLLRMRFFIGVNIQEPRAFGIYQEGGRFIVYKNKSDGSRAVRYNGPDEAYAVNEIYTKLIEECHNRGINPDPPGTSAGIPAPVQTRAWSGSDYGTGEQTEERKAAEREMFYRRQSEKKKKERNKILALVGIIAALIVFLVIGLRNGIPVPLEEGYYLGPSSAVYLYEDLGSDYSKWHIFRDGWVRTDMPFDTTRATSGKYQGKDILPEWNITELKLPEEIPEGYYRSGENLYYYNGKWVRCQPKTDRWSSDFLGYDDEGRLITDYAPLYQGTNFRPEWEGHEFIAKEGYYRYNGKTSYYDSQSESWYTYDSGWKASSYPVNNFGAYYEGTACSGEWECDEMPLTREFFKGYYVCGNCLFFYTGDSWYESEYHKTNSSFWTRDFTATRKKVSSYPDVSGWYSVGKQYPLYNAEMVILDPEECYQGLKNPAMLSRDFIQIGYYRQDNTTYYYDGSSWFYYSTIWRTSPTHPDTIEDYQGTAVSADWGTAAFCYPAAQRTTRNSNSSNDNSRYSDSRDSYSNSRNDNRHSNSRDSDWDSDWGGNDYDSWDSGGSDWDSDW